MGTKLISRMLFSSIFCPGPSVNLLHGASIRKGRPDTSPRIRTRFSNSLLPALAWVGAGPPKPPWRGTPQAKRTPNPAPGLQGPLGRTDPNKPKLSRASLTLLLEARACERPGFCSSRAPGGCPSKSYSSAPGAGGEAQRWLRAPPTPNPHGAWGRVGMCANTGKEGGRNT